MTRGFKLTALSVGLGAVSAQLSEQQAFDEWVLPRCDDIQATPYLERLPVEDDSDWLPYRLRNREGTCVYETMSDERLDDCMQDRWLMYLGGSNMVVQSQHMIMEYFNDPQRSIEYTSVPYNSTVNNREAELAWVNFMYTEYDPLHLSHDMQILNGVFDFSTPSRPEICVGGYTTCNPDIALNNGSHVEGYGYFTNAHCKSYYDVRTNLDMLLSRAPQDMPSPTVFIGVDAWFDCCYRYIRGDDNWCSDWCETEPGLFYEDTVETMTLEKLIDYAELELALTLDKIRDDLPEVREVIHENRQFIQFYFEDRFTPERSQQNGWPIVTFFNNYIDYDISVELEMRQNWHWNGRHAVLLNNWRNDHMCRDNREKFMTYKEPTVSFPESCRVYPDEHFSYILPCEHEVGGAEKVDVIEAAQIIEEEGNETVVEFQIRAEYDSSLTSSSFGSYHNILALCSAIALVAGEIYRRVTMRSGEHTVEEKGVVVASSREPASSGEDSNSGSGSQSSLNPKFDTNDAEAATTDDQAANAAAPVAGAFLIPVNKKLSAIGMARFLASVHIVIGHMTNGFTIDGARLFPLPNWAVNEWGFSWVPFFMMLSGFILTYARINSSNPDKVEPWITFTFKRVRSIYPLFLCGLLARAGQIAAQREVAFSIGTPGETILQLLLLQAWVPKVVVQGLQAHCWFLSCIVPYWAVHQWTYGKLKAASTKSLWLMALAVTVVPFLLLTVIPLALGEDVDWYNAWDGFSFEEPIAYGVAILKFHPLCYFHIYVFGIVTAMLMYRMQEHPEPVQALFRNGALVGFVGLYAIFFLSEWGTFPAHKLTARLGILAPLQGLYLIGLSIESDPIARLFSLSVFAPLEHLSYPQYVFQFIAFFAWHAWLDLGYWLWLFALAMVGYFFVQKPLKSASQPKHIQAAGVINIGLLAAFISILAGAFREEVFELSGTFPNGLPVRTELDNGVFDAQLFAGQQNSDGSVFINPSVVWNGGSMTVAARAHKFELQSSNKEIFQDGASQGEFLHEDFVWTSSVQYGQLDPSTLELVSNLADAPESVYQPCADPEYLFLAGNSSYSRSIVSGQEDPRLAVINGEVVMTTNIYLPNRPEQEACDIQRRMLMTTIGTNQPAVLQWSPTGLKEATEKNWLAFEHGGELKFIQNIFPFNVVKQSSSQFLDGRDTELESSVLFVDLAEEFVEQSLEVHGGSNPIKVQNQNGVFSFAPSEGPVASYVGAFHTKSLDGVYTNYFFEFGFNEAEGVFEILRVSKPIELLEAAVAPGSGVSAPMTFLSGLTSNQEGVFVSYGSSNVQARLRFMPWNVFNEYF